MAEFFVRRPIVAMVIAIIIVIVGFVALGRLPIAQYPEITPPSVQVAVQDEAMTETPSAADGAGRDRPGTRSVS